jgi:hypothetical protein
MEPGKMSSPEQYLGWYELVWKAASLPLREIFASLEAAQLEIAAYFNLGRQP